MVPQNTSTVAKLSHSISVMCSALSARHSSPGTVKHHPGVPHSPPTLQLGCADVEDPTLREGSTSLPAGLKGSLSSSGYSKLKYHIVFLGKWIMGSEENECRSEILIAKLLLPSLQLSATR